MSLSRMLKKHKREELLAVYEWVSGASDDDLTNVVSEIMDCKDNLFFHFDGDYHKSVDVKLEEKGIVLY